jgi:hypothetical protein
MSDKPEQPNDQDIMAQAAAIQERQRAERVRKFGEEYEKLCKLYGLHLEARVVIAPPGLLSGRLEVVEG